MTTLERRPTHKRQNWRQREGAEGRHLIVIYDVENKETSHSHTWPWLSLNAKWFVFREGEQVRVKQRVWSFLEFKREVHFPNVHPAKTGCTKVAAFKTSEVKQTTEWFLHVIITLYTENKLIVNRAEAKNTDVLSSVFLFYFWILVSLTRLPNGDCRHNLVIITSQHRHVKIWISQETNDNKMPLTLAPILKQQPSTAHLEVLDRF